MINIINKYWNYKPLELIMFLAIIVRLTAAIFSRGYGMHDDHFLVIEAAQSWVDGLDYNNWLPKNGEGTPQGHSWTYVGIHYFILSFLNFLGINDPQAKMLIIRILHAAFSLIVPWTGFKITQYFGSTNSARQVGLILALFWMWPFLSVRNLVEIVAIPFLMLAVWFIITCKEHPRKILRLLLAGAFLGLSLSVRYQSSFFVVGVGLVLLFQRKWIQLFTVTAGAVVVFAFTQGFVDYLIWKYPFAEFQEYVRYNMENKYNYLTGPWYNYLLLIGGILIPPISLFIFFGFLRSYKINHLMFWPTLIFLAFHSYFPNKQERFILTIVPFIIILGILGWNHFQERSSFWSQRKKLIKSFWIFFWVINLSLLPFITVAYSKKSKVEAMSHLSKYENVDLFVIEESHNTRTAMMPRYYSKRFSPYLEMLSGDKHEMLQFHINNALGDSYREKDIYILFVEKDESLDKRIENMKSIFPDMKFEAEIEPGLIDKVMHYLNPVNKNQTIIIYQAN